MSGAGSTVVGVLPAAGRAERLGALSSSKEVLPLLPAARGSSAGPGDPVCHSVLRALRTAGVRRVYMVIRAGKEDIPAALGDGSALGLELSYIALDDSPSPAHSVDAAFTRIADRTVALGFPDVILGVEDPFTSLLDRWRASAAEVVLGLFPPDPGYATDRVRLEPGGRVRAFDPPRPPGGPPASVGDAPGSGSVQPGAGVDPAPEARTWTWTLAVWGPTFTRWLHELVAARDGAHGKVDADAGGGAGREELVMGRVMRLALEHGFRIEGVPVAERPFLDVGDPARLARAARRLRSDEASS